MPLTIKEIINSKVWYIHKDNIEDNNKNKNKIVWDKNTNKLKMALLNKKIMK